MAKTKEEMQEHSREYFRKRRESNICPSCGTKTDGSTYCVQCKIKKCSQTRTTVKRRKNRGLCIQCGRVVQDQKNRCSRCSQQMKLRDKRRREILIAQGLCCQCGAKTSGKKRCASCLKRVRDQAKQRKKSFTDIGLCLQCGENDKMIHSVLCQTCHIKVKSYRHLTTSSHWKMLLTLLDSQDWKCPYTGEPLVLGLNDSVDHKLPQTKFPEQASDISNLEWVTEAVNRMKADKTPDEFLALIKQIHDYRSL